MNTIPVRHRLIDFRVGDSVVVLYQGLYNGMSGRFVGPREDPNWADVEEPDGSVRAHPVLWLRRPEDVRLGGDLGDEDLALSESGEMESQWQNGRTPQNWAGNNSSAQKRSNVVSG